MTELLSKKEVTERIRDFLKAKIDEGRYTLDTVDTAAELILKVKKLKGSDRHENSELLKALKRLKVETGSLACLGCGHEQSCSVHGCAIIKKAVKVIESEETK